MKVRKAIFDKHIFGKETIMALYATKKAFSVVTVFGDYVQKRKKSPFGYFSEGRKPIHILERLLSDSLIKVCSGFGLS